MRPDALTVWRNEEVRKRLSWYLSVMRGRVPPKFKIARLIDIGAEGIDEIKVLEEKELWRLHEKGRKNFLSLWKEAKEGSLGVKELEKLEKPKVSFLDLKAELSKRLTDPCRLCERRCMVRRFRGEIGACRLEGTAYVHSAFLHMGEEAPLVPSGTIFYGGCNFTCVYCQNFDISQVQPRTGLPVTSELLARIQDDLASRGARNINHVGGEPTPNLFVIVDSLRYVRANIAQLWNSNFYMSYEALNILLDIIDIWLPDFKYGNNQCALRLSAVPRYFETITRNLKVAVEWGDMIIRHLVLPNHLECCTKPVLRWISKNLPKDKILVNIMDQYTPLHLVSKYPKMWPDIARRPRYEEIVEARRYASELGILWEPIS